MFDSIKRAVRRADSWVNLLTGVGLNHRKTALSFQAALGDYLDDGTLEVLYDLDGIAARIVRAVPNHALREGFAVTTGDAAVDARVKARLDDLGVATRLRLAWTWARLYGGGAVFVGADDGRPPSEPLDLAALRSVRFVVDVDRRNLTPRTWVNDPFSPRYGQPETYQLVQQGGTSTHTTILHASRVVRFDGAEVTMHRRLQLQGWGDSVLQRIYADLQQMRGSHAAVASLLHEASQGVFKIKDLMDMIGNDKEDLLKRRLEIMDMARSVARSILVDAEGESFERTEVGALTGVVEVMDRFANVLAGVSEMPVTVLMGQAPAGLNATGESDIRSWYDAVAAEREAMLRPRLEHVVRLLLLAKDGPTGGVEPEAWKVMFPPLYQMTPAQKAEVRNKQADTDTKYIEKGVLTAAEVRGSRFKPDGWSDETSLGQSAPVTEARAALHDTIVATLARVASRDLPRSSGVALLVGLGLSADDAEAAMGETGLSFFTKPDPTAVTELDALRAENAKLKASNEGHRQYTARVIQRAKEGGLELGPFTAKPPTETDEGDTLEEGDVVAVPAASGVQDARALLRADGGRGVAVVLPLPAAVAVEMAALGGERPEDLHLTLAYLGPDATPDLLTRVRTVVAAWAASTAPVSATLGGIGRFFAGRDKLDPVYLSVDAPHLSEAREALVRDLAAAGVPVSKEHGFVPHVTLAYVPQTTGVTLSNNPNQPNTTLTFTEAAVWSGDLREAFPLGGTPVQKGGA